MEQKKFTDVIRLGHKSTQGVLNIGDKIVIQEKLDGANASFTLDENKLRAFSRNKELDDSNTLGGFYQFVIDSFCNNPTLLNANYIYFGEWLNPHKVKYDGYQKQFFLFDVWDKEKEKYLSFEIVKSEAVRLNLNLIPVFYEGEYQSFEHLQSFVGKTVLNGKLGNVETGEGIVVKNVSYIDRFGRQMFVKLVTDSFDEVQKKKKPKNPDYNTVTEFVLGESVATFARVEKIIYKLQDEELINDVIQESDIKIIFKEVNTRVYEDIIKEESEFLTTEIDIDKFRRAVSSVTNNHIRTVLKNKGIL